MWLALLILAQPVDLPASIQDWLVARGGRLVQQEIAMPADVDMRAILADMREKGACEDVIYPAANAALISSGPQAVVLHWERTPVQIIVSGLNREVAAKAKEKLSVRHTVMTHEPSWQWPFGLVVASITMVAISINGDT
ncbi:MAG: hypothetical protein KDC35_10860 [Acidobacteria bacterium]|nr:hypothetical protein [Acidobacteriota bacterium]